MVTFHVHQSQLTLSCRYTVAFVDYFDREFAKANGDWKKVAEEYLFAPDKLLMNGLVGGCKYLSFDIAVCLND